MAGPAPVAEVCAGQPDPLGHADSFLASPGVVASADTTGGDGEPLAVQSPGGLTTLRPSTLGRRASRARSPGSDVLGTSKRGRSSPLPLKEREACFKSMLRDTMDQSLS